MLNFQEKPKPSDSTPEPEPESPSSPTADAESSTEADDRPLASVVVLREDNGSMRTEPDSTEARAKAREGALRRKTIFEHRLEGAKARAGKLPRLLVGSLAAGATNLMLAKILQEELVPTTAKEAADVAKITHAIYREASGQTAGNLNLTPAERDARMNEINQLDAALKERAKAATDQLGGAPEPDETPEVVVPSEEDDVWEHEDPTV